MIPESIENSIVKYLNSEASIEEMEQLEKWLKTPRHQEIFKEYIKVHYLIDINTLTFDDSKLLESLSQEIRQTKVVSFRHKTQKLLRYASIIILLIASTALFFYFNTIQNQSSEQPVNEVVLKSENGKINILSQVGEEQIKDRSGKVLFDKKDNNLVYTSKVSAKKLTYNNIIVPYGRQFSLELSDGTKVQLNAGTSFKFPVNFIKGQDRKVFIEYGEAYFEVAKDPDHPFVVNNNDLDIAVLGTQFNVSAYPEDKEITTVLVEGSVSLSNDEQSVLLSPGYKANWSNQKNTFSISEADIDLHTGWRSGKIVMKSLPFSKMVKKLERHYNVVINSNDEKLNSEVITATFDEEGIEEVLKLINKIHPITYNIDGETINIFKK